MWSVLYIPSSGDYALSVCQGGPFKTEEEAMQWVRDHRFTGDESQTEYEFDLSEDRVYLMSPDHRMQELCESDFTVVP